MYINLHALQNIPPSCLNRDEENRPKECTFGQVDRMRISSQCFKAAMRSYFAHQVKIDNPGIRTKYLPQQIEQAIMEANPEMPEDMARELAELCIKTIGLKTKEVEEDGEKITILTTLMFVSRKQIQELANIISRDGCAVLSYDDGEKKALKKELVKALQGGNSADQALFGRMVADNPTMSIDGCMNVAHIIGVSELVRQDDFFTAVDECNPRDDSGAGMLGEVRFVSDVVYRYACINYDELMSNLDSKEAVDVVLGAAVRAFIQAEPSARQHSMAAHVPPEYVLVELRNEPMSYVSAYDKPIDCAGSVMDEAVEKLEHKVEQFSKAYDMPYYACVLNLTNRENMDNAVVCENVREMVARVMQAVDIENEEKISE